MKAYTRTFRNGEVGTWRTTMTVGELRAKLAEYPDDMGVMAEWEGTYNGILSKHFEVRPMNDTIETDATLFIDVDRT